MRKLHLTTNTNFQDHEKPDHQPQAIKQTEIAEEIQPAQESQSDVLLAFLQHHPVIQKTRRPLIFPCIYLFLPIALNLPPQVQRDPGQEASNRDIHAQLLRNYLVLMYLPLLLALFRPARSPSSFTYHPTNLIHAFGPLLGVPTLTCHEGED